MLYDIIVAPIEMIVDRVFLFSTNYMEIFGVIGAIVCVSIVINFLTLPIYNVADKIQDEERETQKKLSPYIERIKSVFSGDERFMILQTFYRQNHYSPIYAMRSSISVLIQIPFFMAAYHYLSNNELLKEGGFLFIKNLGKPDALFSVGGFAINVLPIFMTLINVVSGIIYTKGFPVREKIQVYGLAAVFLILLYNSPSGLVLYWIMNNFFSLCKNFVKKTKKPAKTLWLVVLIFLSLTLVGSVILNHRIGTKKQILLIFDIVCILGTFLYEKARAFFINNWYKVVQSRNQITPSPHQLSEQKNKTNFLLFLSSAIGLALLTGLLLPSSVIATGPTEFSFLGKTESPLSYIYSSVCVFTGFFVLWPVVIYKMFSGKVRKIMPPLFFVMFVCALLNAYVFKHDYGTLNATFMLGNPDVLKNGGLFLSLLPFMAAAIVAAIYVLSDRYGVVRFLYGVIFSICLATAAFGVYKTKFIGDEFENHIKVIASAREHKSNNDNSAIDNMQPVYHLSKTKKNVVIFMLDRAKTSYIPYIFKQFPELHEIYCGFKYYPNTLSFGHDTTTGAPALMGGYEYSPQEMNKRSNELLVEKHNESMLVLPKLFLDAGYEVTVTDPILPNYSWSGDLTPFDKYPEITVDELDGKYSELYINNIGMGKTMPETDKTTMKEIKNFCILQIIFPAVRYFFYDVYAPDFAYNFIDAFSTLYFLRNLTNFNSKNNTYTFIVNNATHEPTFLNFPEYDMPFWGKYIENSCGIYQPADKTDTVHYHANAASLKQIAIWLKFLKENDCYDNTRIIIVSDHGSSSNLEPFINFSAPELSSKLNSLLMYKDFNATTDFNTDYTFMSNADTVFLAKKDLAVSDFNPFTGKEFIQEKDNGIDIYGGGGWHIDRPTRFTETKFGLGDGFHVKDNIFDESNWTPIKYKEK